MRERRAVFVGGPVDGYEHRITGPAPPWLWIEPASNPRVAEVVAAYTPTWLPYQADEPVRITSHAELYPYLFAGHTHVICPGCGCLHSLHNEKGRKIDACTLCGVELGTRLGR